MDYLPPGFPKDLLKDPVDLSKVSWFCRRFTSDYYEQYGFGHFILAAYASVPALLTPDLLYRIWMNFSTYQWGNQTAAIHRVAVADLLLSGLCKESGYELYEMPDSIRFSFRKWLENAQLDPAWTNRHLAKPMDIAAFVELYHSADNPGTRRWGKTYSDRQTVEAIGVRNPVEAQNKLFSLLNTARNSEKPKKIEEFRLLDLITRQRDLQHVLQDNRPNPMQAFQNLPHGYEHNALLAEIQKAQLQEEEEALETLVQDNAYLLRDYMVFPKPAGESIEIKVPESVGQKLGQKPNCCVLLIGLNNYQDPNLTPLQGCLNDVENMRKTIDAFYSKNTTTNLQTNTFTDESATLKTIENQLKTYEDVLKDGDNLIVYYSGRDLYNDKGRIFALYDSTSTGADSTGLYQTTLEERLGQIALQKRVHILLITDTCYNIKPHQYEAIASNKLRTNKAPFKGSLVILYASEVGKMAYEKQIEGQYSGDFTRNLAAIVARHDNLDYQTLMAKIREALGEKQKPFLEAFPSTAASYQFPNGKPGTQVHTIRYDAQRGGWILEAGFKKGISPSAGFFPTLLKSSAGQEWKVISVTEDYAQVALLETAVQEPDRSVVFEAILVQSAPFKTRVALADEGREQLQRAFSDLKEDEYYYMIETAQEAELKIAYLEKPWKYYITKVNPKSTSVMEVAIYGETFKEFIKPKLDFITRYLFIQRIEGKDANLKKYFKVQMEAVELTSSEQNLISIEDQSITIRHKEGYRPTFRSNLIGIQPYNGKIYLYAFIATDMIFSIKLVKELVVNENNNPLLLEGSPVTSITFRHKNEVSKQLMEQGITEANDEIRIILSTQALDLKIFEQSGSLGINDLPVHNDTFRLGNWDTIRIPIKILLKEEIQDKPEQPEIADTEEPLKLSVDVYFQLLDLVLWEVDKIENVSSSTGKQQWGHYQQIVIEALSNLTKVTNIGSEKKWTLALNQCQDKLNRLIQQNIDNFIIAKVELDNDVKSLITELRVHFKTSDHPTQIKVPPHIDLAALMDNDVVRQLNWLYKAMENARAVCKVIASNKTVSTGFLTKDGYLWTCSHNFPTGKMDGAATVVFGEGYRADGKFMGGGVSYELDISDLVSSSPNELDFVRVKLIDRSDAPLEQWGGLTLDPDYIPANGAPLSMIAFPRGEHKQADMTKNAVLGQYGPHLFYQLESDKGTSGAPVFDEQWRVVAMHQAKNQKEGFVVDEAGTRMIGKRGGLLKPMWELVQKVATSRNQSASTIDTANLVFNWEDFITAGEARINRGISHHIEPNLTTVTAIGINGDPVEGKVKSATLDAAVVTFNRSAMANLKPEPQTVKLDNLSQRLVRLHVDNRDKPDKELKTVLETLGKAENAAYFAFEDDPAKADYALVKHHNLYYIALPSDPSRPLVMPLRSNNPSLDSILAGYLRHISQWKFAEHLRNSGQNALPDSALKIEILDGESGDAIAVKDGVVRPKLSERQTANNPSPTWRGSIKIKITNQTNRDLYVAALYNSYDFSCNTRALLEPAVVMLEKDQSKWLFDHRANPVIPLKLDESIRLFNWKESNETVKLVYSSEPFDLSALELGGLPSPAMLFRRGGLDLNEGAVESGVALQGWNARNIRLAVENPLYNTVDEAELDALLDKNPNPASSTIAHFMLDLYFEKNADGKWQLKRGLTKRGGQESAGETSLAQRAEAWAAFWEQETSEA